MSAAPRSSSWRRRRPVDGLLGLTAGRIVVGTHALVQEAVHFADLSLAVVDEQHRFGVAQREALGAKGRSPHVLLMTATPIPRTLGQILLADLDVSDLRALPAGRHRGSVPESAAARIWPGARGRSEPRRIPVDRSRSQSRPSGIRRGAAGRGGRGDSRSLRRRGGSCTARETRRGGGARRIAG